MKSRAFFFSTRSRGALHINAIEYLNQFDHLNGETGLLEQLARNALLERLSQLQAASWNRPFTKQRLTAAAHEQSAAPVDNDAPYADHGPFRILSRRRHLRTLCAMTLSALPRCLPGPGCVDGVDFTPVYNTLDGGPRGLSGADF